jgi:hypothetical protein
MLDQFRADATAQILGTASPAAAAIAFLERDRPDRPQAGDAFGDISIVGASAPTTSSAGDDDDDDDDD